MASYNYKFSAPERLRQRSFIAAPLKAQCHASLFSDGVIGIVSVDLVAKQHRLQMRPNNRRQTVFADAAPRYYAMNGV